MQAKSVCKKLAELSVQYSLVSWGTSLFLEGLHRTSFCDQTRFLPVVCLTRGMGFKQGGGPSLSHTVGEICTILQSLTGLMIQFPP